MSGFDNEDFVCQHVGCDLQQTEQAADMWQRLTDDDRRAVARTLTTATTPGARFVEAPVELIPPRTVAARLSTAAAAAIHATMRPAAARLVGANIDVGGVLFPAVWEHDGQVVVDYLDHNDMSGDEPIHGLLVEHLAGTARRHFEGFVGVRIVNVRRPHNSWFCVGTYLDTCLADVDGNPLTEMLYIDIATAPAWMDSAR